MAKKIIKENLVYIIILIILTILSIFVMRSSLVSDITSFDVKVVLFILSIVTNFLTDFFRIITYFGDFYIPLVILVCILMVFKKKWLFYLQAGSYLFAGVFTYLVKFLVARARPVEALIKIPKSYSFPSGHTLTSIVFYIVLVYLLTYKCSKRTKVISLIFASIFATLIAISRVYLGVHYFSDVVGGFIFGIPCLFMIINVIKKNFGDKL